MIFIKMLLAILIASCVHATLPNFGHDQAKESKNSYWMKLGREEIEQSLKLEEGKRAKNVILFLGDGMGISTITAARILKGQRNGRSGEEGYLFFERHLPHTALIKTYNVDRLVPDSAGTGTCYLGGVKTNYGVIGVNAAISSKDTDCKKVEANHVTSIMEMARKAGKAIGVVTTTSITDATPAASYAHTSHRYFQSYLPEQMRKAGCKDIATQLIENEPGISFNVIMGGGRAQLLPKSKGGNRTDEVDLIEKWKQIKAKKFHKDEYRFVQTVDELNAVNPNKVQHLLGLFNAADVEYNSSLPRTYRKDPTLREMSDMAIKILSKYENGFVLLVEGGRIDLASHDNNAYQALHEAVHFDETIESATKLINEDETLVLVTADHSHTLVINGYPKRGTNIFGFSDVTELDNNNKETGKPFTILSYGNGPGNTYGELRPDPRTQTNLGTNTFINWATVRLEWSSHGGEDVALFSNHWPNLVRGVKEQHLIFHVMMYVACLDQYSNEPHCTSADPEHPSSTTKIWIYVVVAVVAAVVAVVFLLFFVLKRKHCIQPVTSSQTELGLDSKF